MKKEVDIIGVPSDLGANKRGSSMGPEAIRIAQLHQRLTQLGIIFTDLGDIPTPIRDTITSDSYLSEITTICTQLATKTAQSYKRNRLPIVLGGDHSLSIGSISGASFAQENIGVIWVDTHADINTPETSPTQNIHGMPLACLLGNGFNELTTILTDKPKISPKNIVIIGLRSVDGKEKENLKKSGVTYYTMKDIDEVGIITIMKNSLIQLKNTSNIHLSFDLDVIDPLYLSSVSTPVTGGLNLRESHLIMEMIASTDKLGSLDIVELNPFEGNVKKDATIAVDLILSALGKSII